jgi:MHS family proline/betaine transporter-like MFS transporter
MKVKRFLGQHKVFLSSYVCNMLEMYDFIVIGMLLPHISPLFFPLEDKISILLAGSVTFFMGFIMRPVGGILFGYIGDIYGRKRALLGSIFGMAFATLCLGLLPTYSTIGILAPILFIILRMVQGTCLGGEGQGANVFVLEHTKGINSGFIGGMLATSNGMAALLGFFISIYVTSGSAPEGSWRLCYLLGTTVAIFGWYLRTHIEESPVFKNSAKQNHTIPLLDVFKYQRVNMGHVFLVIGIGGSLTYTSFTFVNILLSQFVGIPQHISLIFAAGGTVLGMIMVFIGGKVCDLWGPYKTLNTSVCLMLIVVFPIHLLFATGDYLLISVGLLMLAIVTGGVAGTIPYLIASSFPASSRYSGAAFTGNISQAILGGTQPLIALYLLKHTEALWSPAIYLFILGVVFLFYSQYYKKDIISFRLSKS